MCLQCHKTGEASKANPNHLPSHSYYVLDDLSFPLISKDWSAKEELLLLQGIMKCGLGNWADISNQFVEKKSAKDCEEHYFTFYYKCKDDYLPRKEHFIVRGPKQLMPDGTFQVSIDEDRHIRNLNLVKEHQAKKQAEALEELAAYAPQAPPQNIE